MQVVLERIAKNRWGCSSPIVDDQKGNTDSKHAKSQLLDFKFGPLEKQIESYPENISRDIENLFVLEGITKKSAGLYLLYF